MDKIKKRKIDNQAILQEILEIKTNGIYFIEYDNIYYQCEFNNLRKNLLYLKDTNEKHCCLCNNNRYNPRNFFKSSKRDCLDHLIKQHSVRYFVTLPEDINKEDVKTINDTKFDMIFKKDEDSGLNEPLIRMIQNNNLNNGLNNGSNDLIKSNGRNAYNQINNPLDSSSNYQQITESFSEYNSTIFDHDDLNSNIECQVEIEENQSSDDDDDNERIIFLVCQIQNLNKQLQSVSSNLKSVEKELIKLKNKKSNKKKIK